MPLLLLIRDPELDSVFIFFARPSLY